MMAALHPTHGASPPGIAMDSTEEELIAACPVELQAIIEQFQQSTPRERLELLLEFANDLPELPARLHGARDAMEQVHECQSPVFLHTELVEASGESAAAGGREVQLYFDIPREAPTIRGYASVLLAGLAHATPEAVLATPEAAYMLLGLHEAITPQRLRGLHALMVYIKRQIRKLNEIEKREARSERPADGDPS